MDQRINYHFSKVYDVLVKDHKRTHIAHSMGYTTTTQLENVLAGVSLLSSKAISNLVKSHEVSPTFLFTGRGEMFLNTADDVKYLFIDILVREGEREHNHRCLHSTTGSDIQFAANRYLSTYWGYGERDSINKDYFWFHGEIMAKVDRVKQITKKEYDFLHGIFY